VPEDASRYEVAVGTRRIRLVSGDITQVPADAIVNAANASLAGGGGVDGAIHRAGGPSIMAELRQRYDGCPTGGAVLTTAGDLPARWVIHAVGPRWRGGRDDEERLLASAYREALARAEEVGARVVTFPAISCGIYGYPLDDGARLALESVKAGLERGTTSVEEVTFVLRGDDTLDAFRRALASLERGTAD
jgi:O-acetyl-ADP-ribose deacetylase (regulator of RNase III)